MILGVVLFFDGALLALGNVRPFLCCMGIFFFGSSCSWFFDYLFLDGTLHLNDKTKHYHLYHYLVISSCCTSPTMEHSNHQPKLKSESA